MAISAMVAATDNHVISKDGIIPWKMPHDEKHMDSIISGHALIMGRTTYDFMGKAYPGCTNIVVSRHIKELPDAIVVNSVQDALNLEEVKKDNEPFIFGGESIFNEVMQYTQKIYLTRIHANIDGDRFFHFDPTEWKELSHEEHKKDDKNPYDYDFIILVRRAGDAAKKTVKHYG
jgi:dihydrofolate reductase